MRPLTLTILVLAVAMGSSMANPQHSEGFTQIFKLFGNNDDDDTSSGSGGFFRTLLNVFTNRDGDEESSGSILRTIFKNLVKIFRSSGSGGGEGFPVEEDAETGTGAGDGEVLERMVDFRSRPSRPSPDQILNLVRQRLESLGLEMPNPREIILDVIDEFCCEDDCSNKTSVCIDALKPAVDMSEHHRQCFRNMMEAFFKGVNPLAAKAQCIAKELFDKLELVYDPEDPSSNVVKYLEATVLENSRVNGAAIVQAVVDKDCVPPSLKDLQIGDPIKFYACVVRKCVTTFP